MTCAATAADAAPFAFIHFWGKSVCSSNGRSRHRHVLFFSRLSSFRWPTFVLCGGSNVWIQNPHRFTKPARQLSNPREKLFLFLRHEMAGTAKLAVSCVRLLLLQLRGEGKGVWDLLNLGCETDPVEARGAEQEACSAAASEWDDGLHYENWRALPSARPLPVPEEHGHFLDRHFAGKRERERERA